MLSVSSITHVAIRVKVVVKTLDFFAGKLTVLQRSDEHVEVAVWFSGDVRQAGAIRRERWIHVNVRVARQRLRLAGLHVQHLQLDRAAPLIRRIHDPFAVG